MSVKQTTGQRQNYISLTLYRTYIILTLDVILYRETVFQGSYQNLLEEPSPTQREALLKLCYLAQQPPGGISFHILQTLHSIRLQEKHPHQDGDPNACNGLFI